MRKSLAARVATKTALAAMAASAVACSKVPAGNVGIKVFLLGQSKGVDHEVLGPGRYWIGMNEDLFLFPTFRQNHVYGSGASRYGLEFQTKEGLRCGTDVGVTYYIPPANVAQVFQAYRRGVQEINDVFLFNTIRDAFNAVASTMTMDVVYGPGKAAMIEEVTRRVSTDVRRTGIEVEKIYLVGGLGLPDTVERSISAKIAATEKAILRENELRQAEAEAKKVVATERGEAERRVVEAKSRAESELLRAQANAEASLLTSSAKAKGTLMQYKAEAEGNRELSRSMSTNIVDYERAKRWDGKLPHIFGQPGMVFQSTFK